VSNRFHIAVTGNRSMKSIFLLTSLIIPCTVEHTRVYVPLRATLRVVANPLSPIPRFVLTCAFIPASDLIYAALLAVVECSRPIPIFVVMNGPIMVESLMLACLIHSKDKQTEEEEEEVGDVDMEEVFQSGFEN
jgi:hypothetical protein